jgi:transposase
MAIQEAMPIALTAAERATLAGWVGSGKTEHRLVVRAWIVLRAGDGWGSRAIAREVGCARGVVSRWRVRFATDRLAGLADAPRAGKRKTYGADARRRILALLERPPPAGFARWTAPLLAKELGDISDQHVWRFLRAQRIALAGRKSWCLSSDPSSPPRPPTSSGSTSIRPTMRSSSRSMRNRPSRRSSGRRVTSSCPTADRSTAKPTSTSGAARPPSFTSVHKLRRAIDAFIERYNQHAVPFEWRKAGSRGAMASWSPRSRDDAHPTMTDRCHAPVERVEARRPRSCRDRGRTKSREAFHGYIAPLASGV